MRLAAEEIHSGDIAGPVVVILLLAGALIFSFGFLYAVMKRANSDYKTTKAALPGLRKGFWSSWWKATKAGFWVMLIFVCLLLWWIRGGDKNADANPQPSPSLTSKHQR
jgi:hypothetical protein